MSRVLKVLALSGIAVLAGCMSPPPKVNDPYYAPVLPRTPLPAASNNGSIYQAGFEQGLYSDRKAFRVGDIITVTLAEKTSASKSANSKVGKDSTNSIGLTSLFGSKVVTNNPLGGDLSLNAGYNGSRATNA
jgi:flagellar L-ring protein precursor FlgH